MKTILSFLTVLFLSNLVLAQTTVIPDPNFEQALINLGYDTGVPDGVVLTANIDTITILNVAAKNISNLTGIEDFSALDILNCSINQLTNLNLNQNASLRQLLFIQNQITSLDVSQNNALELLFCGSNQLNCLNMKNGHNNIMSSFNATNNPNLSCIEVDDSLMATNYSNWVIDASTNYSNNCNNTCTVIGIDEHNLSQLSIYPNPTSGKIFIDLEGFRNNFTATLSNTLGQIISTKKYSSVNIINIDAPIGIYFLHLETEEGETKTIKILKE